MKMYVGILKKGYGDSGGFGVWIVHGGGGMAAHVVISCVFRHGIHTFMLSLSISIFILILILIFIAISISIFIFESILIAITNHTLECIHCIMLLPSIQSI